ncbi:MAG TPA: trypsin-like serine protease [Burkholderiales bacterium]|nr:trypsin-like serine protease [Burkholderiales bacterium]
MLVRIVAFALLCVVPASPLFAITGGVAVDDVLSGNVATDAADQFALARAVVGSTVSLGRLNAQGNIVSACTATIIHPRVVLTAAHCVPEAPSASSRIVLYFGAFGGAVRREGLDVSVHPRFADASRIPKRGNAQATSKKDRIDAARTSADLALVLLHRPAPAPYRAVQVVPPGFRDSRQARKIIAGFGQTSGEGKSEFPRLHFAEVIGNTRIDQGASGNSEIVLMSRFSQGARVSTCSGDSGGPVFVVDPAGGLRQLAVASAADEHCRGAEVFASIDSERRALRAMFESLMQGEQGGHDDPF